MYFLRIHAYFDTISAWTCLIALILIFSQLFSVSWVFAFEDFFLNEHSNKDFDGSSSLFPDVDDLGAGDGGPLFSTEQPQKSIFDDDVAIDNNAFTKSNVLFTDVASSSFSPSSADHDAPLDACNGYLPPPSSFQNIQARAASSCSNPNLNGVNSGAAEGTETKTQSLVTAEQIKRYWCTDFTSASVSILEGGFGNIPVCYGPEGEGLSGSSEGGPILPNIGFDQSADVFRTLYNCVLSEFVISYFCNFVFCLVDSKLN